MTSIGHSVVGASIGLASYSCFSNFGVTITVATVVGLASHYICDYIPHGHYKDISLKEVSAKGKLIVASDALLPLAAIVVIVYLRSDLLTTFIVFIGVASAVAPDVVEFIYQYLKVIPKNKILEKHKYFHSDIIHWHSPKPGVGRLWSWTDIWQLIPLAVFIWQIAILQ